MRKRRGRIGIAVIASIAVLVAWIAPAGASGGVSACQLLKKKEASKLLGAKVVKTKNRVDVETGAQDCTYRTNTFDSDLLEQMGAPLQLTLAWGPITDTQRGQYEGSKTVAGLGDAAYDLGFGRVVAISGEQSVQATIENSEAAPAKLAKKAQQAIRRALNRLPTD